METNSNNDSSSSSDSDSDSDDDSDSDSDDKINLLWDVAFANSKTPEGDLKLYYQTTPFNPKTYSEVNEYSQFNNVDFQQRFESIPTDGPPTGSIYIVVSRQEGRWTIAKHVINHSDNDSPTAAPTASPKRKRPHLVSQEAYRRTWESLETVAPKKQRTELNSSIPQEAKEDYISLMEWLKFAENDAQRRDFWDVYSAKHQYIAKQNPFQNNK
tara:strand:- start:319 stop:957 length:639 start_codon:yes stop_codon:yes gene_type:complete